MSTQQTSKWLVDAALFAGLIAAFFLDLTGLELHQWIGVITGAIALYHLVSHWDWLTALAKRFLLRASNRSRLYYLLDTAILLGFAVLTFTGLVLSSWLHLTLSNSDSWLTIHILASISALILTTIKIVLHWRWVASATRKVINQPVSQVNHSALPGRSTGGQVSRQDFLKVIGVVGVASLLALARAVESLQGAGAESLSSAGSTASQAGSAGGAHSLSNNPACTETCPRRCSYPGHCHRYVDMDNDGRCDIGECT
jgi:hypothetical protein